MCDNVCICNYCIIVYSHTCAKENVKYVAIVRMYVLEVDCIHHYDKYYSSSHSTSMYLYYYAK